MTESSNSLAELTEKIGVCVPDELLHLALTHPSAVGEGLERTLLSNQRLEFLGDAVLGAVAVSHLYCTYPELPEGALTQRKAAAVRKQSLAQAARRLNLGHYLRLSAAEEAAGGRSRDTIIADALEAVIGAIFLAHGFETARDFVLRALDQELASVAQHAVNIKNLLQEKTQAAGLGTPIYRTASMSGPAHRREFSAEVLVQNVVRGRGRGRSKQEAEYGAANQALEELRDVLEV